MVYTLQIALTETVSHRDGEGGGESADRKQTTTGDKVRHK